MTMPNTEILTTVGISVSESPDLWVLGLSDGHLRDALAWPVHIRMMSDDITAFSVEHELGRCISG